MNIRQKLLILLCGFLVNFMPLTAHGFTNSIGMEFVQIPAGTFTMGSNSGDPDEKPVHQVTISNAFYMGITEVTNAQYEQFDPSHSAYRSTQTYNNGYTISMSDGDNEAVIYVSWEDANDFCAWLSVREGVTYRLPTEAEWEYACRAGTTTDYSTGSSLASAYQKSQSEKEWPTNVDLTVKSTAQNAWGLWEMHGNVEEWCCDWYGPYESGSQTNPVGRAKGHFRVARGGAHNTHVYYLRSANRHSSLPDDKQWLTGFRVVKGELPNTPGLPAPAPKLWATNVSQTPHLWPKESDVQTPFFTGPQVWVRDEFEGDASIPMWSHNHQPAVTFCDNGDLLGAWYSTQSTVGGHTERDRRLTVLASRLRKGQTAWEKPAEFFKAQDRNMHGSALLNDGSGKLYLFNGLAADYGWMGLALCTSTSTDNGVTWQPRVINPDHSRHHQVVAGAIKTSEGYIIASADANPGSAIHISKDDGQTFVNPGQYRPVPSFVNGTTGAWIAGIHTGFVQLQNGSLLAFGRGNDINGYMPRNLSTDMGQNWTYSASPFPPIGGGQRCVLLRLQYSSGERIGVQVSNPVLMVSFASSTTMLDGGGTSNTCSGMFAALSYDEGQTWTTKKLISNLTSGSQSWDAGGNTGSFTLSRTTAEPKGYLSATQTPDGFINICSSRLYYMINLKWIDPDYNTEEPLVGDFSGNCVVNGQDLEMLTDDWLKHGTSEPRGSKPDANGLILHYNFDGTLNGDITTVSNLAGPDFSLTKFNDSGGAGVLKYGAANPMIGTGTSADFQNSPTANDPGSGLFTNDTGANTAIDLSTIGKFTVEAFIKPRALRQCVIIRKYTSNTSNLWYLDLRGEGQAAFSINADTNAIFTGPGSIAADTWYHVAGVFDENTGMKIYLDGVEKSSRAYTTRPGDSANSLSIGAIVRDNANPPANSGQFYDGMVDELKIYDYALTEDELIYDAHNGPALVYTPLDSVADLVQDDIIDLKDFAAFALHWLEECE